MCQCIKDLLKHRWASLIAWQICSLDMCFIGSICTQMNLRFKSTLPLLMLTGAYIFILIGTVFLHPKTDVAWWKYAILALTSVGGDFLCINAYQYTSLSSAILMATTVIFFVAPLAYFVFKRKINLIQFIFMLVAALGVSLVLVADGTKDSHLSGNLMALFGSVCYAISTVTQEALVTDASVSVYLFRFSLINAPVGTALTGIFEWKDIFQFKWDFEAGLYVILYSVFLALYDCLSPFIMQFSTATDMNISMLTSNFYSLLVSALFFKTSLSWLYLVGFFCIPIAIVGFTYFETKPITNDIPLLENDESITDSVNK